MMIEELIKSKKLVELEIFPDKKELGRITSYNSESISFERTAHAARYEKECIIMKNHLISINIVSVSK